MKTRAASILPHRTETHRIEERRPGTPVERKTAESRIRQAAATPDKRVVDTMERPPKSQPKMVVHPSIATEVNPKLQTAISGLKNLPIGGTEGVRIDAHKGTILLDPSREGGRGGLMRIFDMNAHTVNPAFVVNATGMKDVSRVFAEKLQEHLRQIDPSATVVSVVIGDRGAVAIVPQPSGGATWEEAKAQAIVRLTMRLGDEAKARASGSR